MVEVLNHRDNPRHGIYVGRPTKWGNPFSHLPGKGQFQVGSREEAVARYREWIAQRPELVDELRAKRPTALICWCAPLACHADVLAELLDD